MSSTEFEVILYLNQMGVFNFVDDGSLPGCAVLKLSDGRKRSMSLWVEFITASGYLSARKIRSRFQTLVSISCQSKCSSKKIGRLVDHHRGMEKISTRQMLCGILQFFAAINNHYVLELWAVRAAAGRKLCQSLGIAKSIFFIAWRVVYTRQLEVNFVI